MSRIGDRAAEAALVTAVLDGDAAAFTTCFRAHAPALDASAGRRGARHLAEDARQEVLTRLWADPGRFDPARGGLGTFLHCDLAGRSIDMLRADESRHRREEASERSRQARPVDSPESQAERADVAAVVRRALLALPPREREAIVLAFFEDLTYRQVAEHLGEPEGTVKSRIRSGMGRLSTLLADHAPLRRADLPATA